MLSFYCFIYIYLKNLKLYICSKIFFIASLEKTKKKEAFYLNIFNQFKLLL